MVIVANRTVCPPPLQNAPIKRWSPLLVGKFNDLMLLAVLQTLPPKGLTCWKDVLCGYEPRALL